MLPRTGLHEYASVNSYPKIFLKHSRSSSFSWNSNSKFWDWWSFCQIGPIISNRLISDANLLHSWLVECPIARVFEFVEQLHRCLLSKAPSTPERFRSKTHQFFSDAVLPSCIDKNVSNFNRFQKHTQQFVSCQQHKKRQYSWKYSCFVRFGTRRSPKLTRHVTNLLGPVTQLFHRNSWSLLCWSC